MNYFQKIQFLVAGAFLLFTFTTPQLATAAFSDVVKSHTNYDAIMYVQTKGIVDGYPNGTFKPSSTINRAEFSKILIRALGHGDPADKDCFPDVQNEWFSGYVCKAKNLGIISGYPDGSFKPANTINLAEILKMVFLGFDIQTQEQSNIWYQPYLDAALQSGYLSKISTAPSHFLTRGEMAQLIYNIQVNVAETPSDTYSWDESWNPAASDFPLAGLIDNEYTDLPPGVWDWNDANNDNANWRNFEGAIGHFTKLLDSAGHHFGWKLIGNSPDAIDYGGPAAYFEGTPGIDILNLGKNGLIHSFTNGNMGDGPDVLVFDKSYSLDFRTGSTQTGFAHDNDLVIAGCQANTNTDTEIITTTIHTGPGADKVFVRDMSRAAIDAGNGDGGMTSVLDPHDGDDVVVYRGNMYDFRFFGGKGNDTAIWYVDEVNQSTTWLYPNFFGGGGSGDAIWGDDGTDRLVLVIPSDTEIVSKTPTQPGQLLVRIDPNYAKDIQWDAPVYNDLNARYCIECGQSSDGRKTVILEYRSLNGKVFTGYFYITGIEELQLGFGNGSKVYRIDDKTGIAILDVNLKKTDEVVQPPGYCE